MPKTDPKAVLEIDDIRRAYVIAQHHGPLPAALFAWMYEFGARADEPGKQLRKDLDMQTGRARPVHLKGGKAKEWHALLPFCREALPSWLEHAARGPMLFPTQRASTRCYPCKGTGQRAILRLDKATGQRRPAETVPCHHCGATGQRQGLSRFEAHAIITTILTEAGLPPGRRHPHVLRHSIISHLLEGGIAPTVIQDRVGHRLLTTTLSYASATKAAAAQLQGALKGLYG